MERSRSWRDPIWQDGDDRREDDDEQRQVHQRPVPDQSIEAKFSQDRTQNSRDQQRDQAPHQQGWNEHSIDREFADHWAGLNDASGAGWYGAASENSTRRMPTMCISASRVPAAGIAMVTSSARSRSRSSSAEGASTIPLRA